MNHLDEGTIHAWLDGALDATRSREIEAHVAGCAACSAAVAEARGLIAGASRILGALDDVPAGVIPGGAMAAPPTRAPAAPARTAAASPPRTAARLKPRGRWQIARWASGIAAVLVGAVVLSTAHRASPMKEMPQQGVRVTLDSSLAASAPMEEAARAAESVAQPAAPTAVVPAPQRDVQKTSVAPAPRDPATKAVGAATGNARAAESRDLASAAAIDTTRMRRAEASGVQVGTVDSARVRRLGEGTTRLSEVVVTSVASTATEAEQFIGCYRLEPQEDRRIADAIAAEAARRARGVARGAVPPPARAPSPAAAAERADYSSGRVPPVIRLDTAAAALGLTVVDPMKGSATGWWRVLGDSARVDLGTRGVVMLSIRDKVTCPDQ